MIAEEFGVSEAEVLKYHAAGIGYGILAQFYSIANGRCGTASGYSVDQLVALKQSGMGMGAIRTQVLGSASASECSLGKLKKQDLDDADAKEAAEKERVAKEKQANEKPAAAQKQEKAKPAKPQAKPAKPQGNGGGGNSGGGKGK